MIISHEHKFIFFHIPKTGGSSLTKYLCKYGKKLKHPGPHFTYSNLNRDFFRFGFVRNPGIDSYQNIIILKKMVRVLVPINIRVR